MKLQGNGTTKKCAVNFTAHYQEVPSRFELL